MTRKIALYVGAPIALLAAIACGSAGGVGGDDAPRNPDTTGEAPAAATALAWIRAATTMRVSAIAAMVRMSPPHSASVVSAAKRLTEEIASIVKACALYIPPARPSTPPKLGTVSSAAIYRRFSASFRLPERYPARSSVT